ncbi:hypothetical protein LKO31_09020 [Sphingopyxis sp. FBM22]|nr:hypothetical protein [Sphingopyxis yananensis]
MVYTLPSWSSGGQRGQIAAAFIADTRRAPWTGCIYKGCAQCATLACVRDFPRL